VGTSEPFVTRLIIGLSDVLNATSYQNKQEIKEAIAELTHECVMSAFQSLRELRQIANGSDIPVLRKTKSFDDMYKYLWTAYKDRMQSTAKLLGYDLGFLFQQDVKFRKGCEDFPKANPEVHPSLIGLIKHNRAAWQPDFLRFRNDYLEHHKIQREAVASFYCLERAELTFASVWITIEEILVVLIATKLPSTICLREIPEAERIPSLPKRFEFAWADGRT
jgi:hypothetical protein